MGGGWRGIREGGIMWQLLLDGCKLLDDRWQWLKVDA